ncbi:bestrophin family ion channel [Salinisphaera sp. SPP-AMP-43]|uniref:bestrophin family protein n=1 Tax=Salinisphaera sp. SPP-AMP-43 TaxID=3121288 RepID=UPI003C6E93CF
MIIPTIPRVRQIIGEVWKPLLLMMVWDVIITVLYYVHPGENSPYEVLELPAVSLTLLGTVIALFLGFRTNSAYARWWEGRVLWGRLLNASRNIGRDSVAFIGRDNEHTTQLSDAVVLNQAAFVHTLRCQLRGIHHDRAVERLLDAQVAERVLRRSNPANAILEENAKLIAKGQKQGLIDTIQQTQMDRVLIEIANSQGGLERIKNTPLPMQYRFFPHLFVRLFCLLLPISIVSSFGWFTPIGSTLVGLMFLAALRVGDDLVDPFANSPHDLPLTSICTVIETDLVESIGHPAPEPVTPVNGVLW